MGLIQFTNINKRFGPFDVLTGVSGEIFAKDRIGLVGPNGIGKTTLLRILLGELEEDEGNIVRQRGLKTAYLSQMIDLDETKTVIQVALEGNEEVHRLEQELNKIEERLATAGDHEINAIIHEQAAILEKLEHSGGYRHKADTETVLGILGFTPEMFSLSARCLSGGQKNRLGLARALLSDSHLLVFDEPTNFLDLQGIEWLENYLVQAETSMLMISHDRYFLNKVATDIWEIRQGKLHCYKGNYHAYWEAREIELERQQEAYDRQQAEIRRQQEFIGRIFYGERHGQAQSRRKMIEKMEKVAAPVKDGTYQPHFNIQAPQARFDKILEITNLGHSFGDHRLFNGLSLTLNRGERMGIVGPNGCGKSTLLNIITGQLTPQEGKAELGSRVQVGFYQQELQDLVETVTVFDTIKKLAPTTDDKFVRDFLGKFLFRGDDVFKKVAKLSGGEKGRLCLARLLWEKPNFLIMDEPTNHLDIFSRQSLESALLEYGGTLIFVSHDRYFIDQVATRLLVFHEKSWFNFYGNYTQFQAGKEELLKSFHEQALRKAAQEEKARKQLAGKQSQPKDAKSSKGGQEGKSGQESKKHKPARRKYSLESLEKKIMDSEARLAQLGDELSRAYQNPEKIKELRKEYDETNAQLQTLNQEWESWT